MPEIRISLTEKNFKDLITGEIVEIDSKGTKIKIILQDIGYDNMINIILNS